MISTSRMCGTSVSVVRPSASSAAAISLSTLFFAPVTRTSPAQPGTTDDTEPLHARHRRVAGMVNLTRIYTRTGDDGTTGYGGRGRISKNDPRLEAYADCDEAGAFLGVALASGAVDDDVAAVLTRVQNDLFDVGADLCTPVEPDPKYPPLRVEQAQVDALEARHRPLQRRPAAAALVRARRAVRRQPPTCTSRAPSYAGPSGPPGARSRPTPTPSTRSPRRTSTGSRTCCSCWPGYANREVGDVLWVPGGDR